MSITLKIRNFGAIRGGYTSNDGYLPFCKFTVITGPQASGKSSIAKLYALFSWLEKSIVRHTISEDFPTKYNRFRKQLCAYHGLTNYFHDDTFLDYRGFAYRMTYKNQRLTVSSVRSSSYIRPKVMYVPAERNLLSVLEDAENVKNLPGSMSTLLSRYVAACKRQLGPVALPLDNAVFKYDKLNKIAWVDQGGKPMRLTETASGVQSLVPMFVVLDDLSRHLDDKSKSLSLKEQTYIKTQVEKLLRDKTLSDTVRRVLLEQVSDTSNKRLVSVIEEPEQNLFPSAQRKILNSLLAINNNGENSMLITTHSPFVINYLALAIKAGQVIETIPANMVGAMDLVVPTSCAVNSNEVKVYEIAYDGTIRDVCIEDGVLSDDNVLNRFLMDGNEAFNQLLEIEDGFGH